MMLVGWKLWLGKYWMRCVMVDCIRWMDVDFKGFMKFEDRLIVMMLWC